MASKVARRKRHELAVQQKFRCCYCKRQFTKDGPTHGAGGWRFIAPVEGMRAWRRDNGQAIAYRNGAWETGVVRASEVRIGDEAVVRQRQPAIADPAGGATADLEGRAAIAGILAALRAHGLIKV